MGRVAILSLLLGLMAPASADADRDDKPAAASKAGNPWAAAAAAASGSARSIGGYSAGCVRGAEVLPDSGRGFQLARPGRNKNFGHPVLVDFVRDLGAAVAESKLGVLFVGDLGQPRGGPAPNGHSSHQTGLDADIWYWHPPSARAKVLPAASRSGLSPRAIVSVEDKKATRHFTREVTAILRHAATDKRVARIFVNPLIKRELCERVPAAKRGWLRKLRPWWGHAAHFHVRLECPGDSDTCEPQGTIADGDGCAEIDWWLDEKAQADRRKKRATYRKRVRELPELPAECAALLH